MKNDRRSVKKIIVKKVAQAMYELRLLKGYWLDDKNKYHFIWFWEW